MSVGMSSVCPLGKERVVLFDCRTRIRFGWTKLLVVFWSKWLAARFFYYAGPMPNPTRPRRINSFFEEKEF
jgi:hypothetical protein